MLNVSASALINISPKSFIKNINDFIINLDIIEFEPLFKLYKSSLFNTELLANITVRKQKANILLTKVFSIDYINTL